MWGPETALNVEGGLPSALSESSLLPGCCSRSPQILSCGGRWVGLKRSRWERSRWAVPCWSCRPECDVLCHLSRVSRARRSHRCWHHARPFFNPEDASSQACCPSDGVFIRPPVQIGRVARLHAPWGLGEGLALAPAQALRACAHKARRCEGSGAARQRLAWKPAEKGAAVVAALLPLRPLTMAPCFRGGLGFLRGHPSVASPHSPPSGCLWAASSSPVSGLSSKPRVPARSPWLDQWTRVSGWGAQCGDVTYVQVSILPATTVQVPSSLSL